MIAGFCCCLLLAFIGCKKGGSPPPLTPEQAQCLISGESTSLVGNEKTFEYHFDEDGNPKEVKVFNRYGDLDMTYTIYSDRVIRSYDDFIIELKYDADIFNSLPSKAQISITEGVTTQVNYYTYFFFYDNKDRLTTVSEQTDYVPNDLEWDLHISYNEKGNVDALQYEITTGPRGTTTIVPTGYDNNPSPYAGIKCWQFLMINFGWDNYDPEPVITALSKNNLLGYNYGSSKREMIYKYNGDGYPIERANTGTPASSSSSFLQTFAYNCK